MTVNSSSSSSSVAGSDANNDSSGEMPVKETPAAMTAPVRCFFDVQLGGLPAGRIVFELYTSTTPRTCENFRALCTGERGVGRTTGKPLHYKGVIFHRVVKDFMVQSGDFSAGNGTGGESIYGGTFDDETFDLKHDKPFLLSMANRGAGTNGSQFFITTQPAPHLDNVHVVFGHVVSGTDLVRQLEQLPVDRNSRPLQDATINNCGELVRLVKAKKDKKKQKKKSRSVDSSSDSSDDNDDGAKDKKRKAKKKSKKSKKSSKSKKSKRVDNEPEDGELADQTAANAEEEEGHSMVTLTNIDPNDIPEVSNTFLMRGVTRKADTTADTGGSRRGGADEADDRRRGGGGTGRDEPNSFGWSKKRAAMSRGGRVIKGRGVFRYRSQSRSRSRSKSVTPPHWKQAQKRVIKLSDLEKAEEEQREHALEVRRRESERKRRHDEMAKDSKKSFFELNQENAYKKPSTTTVATTAVRIKKEAHADIDGDSADDREDGELDTTADVTLTKESRVHANASMDMNALDYEDISSDREEASTTTAEPQPSSKSESAAKSVSMAHALGVQVKSSDLDAPHKTATSARKTVVPAALPAIKLERPSDAKRSDGDRRNERNTVADTKPADRHHQRRDQRDHRQDERRDRERDQRPAVSASVVKPAADRPRDRRRSRSHIEPTSSDRRGRGSAVSRDTATRDRRPAQPQSQRRSRTRSRSRARASRSHSPVQRRRPSSRERRDHRDDRRRASRSRSVRRTGGGGRSRSRSTRQTSRSRDRRQRTRSPLANADVSAAAAAVVVKVESTVDAADERERLAREKMQKRAEALLLLKDHMRKEIEEQKRQVDARVAAGAAAAATATADQQAADDKHEATPVEIKQLAAVKKVLEVVAAGVKNAAAAAAAEQKYKASRQVEDRRRSRSSSRSRSRSSNSTSSSSSSSSSSSADERRRNRGRRGDRDNRRRRSHSRVRSSRRSRSPRRGGGRGRGGRSSRSSSSN